MYMNTRYDFRMTEGPYGQEQETFGILGKVMVALILAFIVVLVVGLVVLARYNSYTVENFALTEGVVVDTQELIYTGGRSGHWRATKYTVIIQGYSDEADATVETTYEVPGNVWEEVAVGDYFVVTDTNVYEHVNTTGGSVSIGELFS